MSKHATSSTLCMYIIVIVTVISFITNSIDRFSEAGKNGNIYQILPFILRSKAFVKFWGFFWDKKVNTTWLIISFLIFSKPMLEIGILAITEFNLKNMTTIFVFLKRIYHPTYQLNEIIINIIYAYNMLDNRHFLY